MTTDQELRILQIAENAGIDVVYDTNGILHTCDLGGWFPDKRRIYIKPGLGWRNHIHTLAHELGHALLNHPAGHVGKYERQADEFAAHLLIDRHAYMEAETMYGGHTGAIAQELGVTRTLIETWQSLYERQLV